MDNNSLKIYIKQIHNINPLTDEEEAELFRKSKGKGKEAKKARLRLIETNLPIVITLAKKYYYPSMGIEFVGFIGEGNIGLMKAVEKFDPDKGYKFSTYASWWIEKYFQEAILRSRSVIHLPEKKFRDLKKIEETASTLLQESGTAPDYKNVADRINMSISKVRDTIISTMKMKYVKSLDYYLDTDKTKTLKDIIADDGNALEKLMEKISVDQQLRELFDELTPEEKKVVTLRFGLNGNKNHTYKEISCALKISSTRARDIQDAAIRKLRHIFKKRSSPE